MFCEVFIMLRAVLLAAAVSADAFAFAFSYGAKKTKLTFLGVTIIALLGGAFLGISLAVASVIEGFLPPEVSSDVLGIILIVLGFFSAALAVIKIALQKRSAIFIKKIFGITVRICFSYSKEEERPIASTKEAIAMGIALSLDSLAAGFAAGMTMTPSEMIVSALIALFGGIGFELLGMRLGEKLAMRVKSDLSYLSGLLLLTLGVITIIAK